jgi:hypothetical protein
VQYESFRILPNNQEQVDTTQTILVVEKMTESPQNVLDLFGVGA